MPRFKISVQIGADISIGTDSQQAAVDFVTNEIKAGLTLFENITTFMTIDDLDDFDEKLIEFEEPTDYT